MNNYNIFYSKKHIAKLIFCYLLVLICLLIMYLIAVSSPTSSLKSFNKSETFIIFLIIAGDVALISVGFVITIIYRKSFRVIVTGGTIMIHTLLYEKEILLNSMSDIKCSIIKSQNWNFKTKKEVHLTIYFDKTKLKINSHMENSVKFIRFLIERGYLKKENIID